ncbi:hypothetical protein [Shewanella surugensis]|uniref:Uncharacterized protein n=1 Tax=Shewanella surugensis TaxID=212020 RepID=A0ABT0L9S1_9GAMM|nr:hypothetical protein [Shewanella surugensis]MCL1124459.1 hypothetical protein [Shewanella surugensis]
MPKIKKKELMNGAVFSIHVEGEGYTLAQLRDDCQMEVFNILREEDVWDNIDLNEVEVLFCIVVASHRLLKLFSRNVTNEIIVNSRNRILLGLSYTQSLRHTGLFGFNLIEYDNPYNSNNERILIENLDPVEHKDILYSYESLGMNGKPDKIKDRISRYFMTGINWDVSKEVLYPELQPPSKDYKKTIYEP